MPDLPQEAHDALTEALDHVGDPLILPHLERFRETYAALSPDARLAIFDHLATELEANFPSIRKRASELADQPDLTDADTIEKVMGLRCRIDAPRLNVLREFVNTPGGIKFLVDMRADLLKAIKAHPDMPQLQLVDSDLLHLFRSWFNFGFLRLVPIDWDTTPAAQLEKLMAYEVVHPMSDWAELRRRLQRDRLCFAFYHPNMPAEPLIFVEVALTRTVFDSIDRLFSQDEVIGDPADASCALFYSINATQPGLSGVSLGNSLIKQVVAELRKRYPHLSRFATLSPIPGFRDRYLEPILQGSDKAKKFSLKRADIIDMISDETAEALQRHTEKDNPVEALREAIATDDWLDDVPLRLAIKPTMLRLVLHYLTHEKRGQSPLNPVTNFHMKNGAVLYNINFLSNTSDKGLAESFGLTVNYLYDLAHIDENQQRVRKGEAPVMPQLEKMVRLGVSA